MTSRWLQVQTLLLALGLLACGTQSGSPSARESTASGGLNATANDNGEPVTPPFAVAGNAEGLMLWWYDQNGVHIATSREAIPAERRAEVRVDSPNLDPSRRLDPDFVYVADLRAESGSGYAVRKQSRDAFDRRVEAFTTDGTGNAGELAPQPEPVRTPEALPSSQQDVVIYSASWCGACRQAKAYMRSRGINFVERDIERDPGARDEMLGKLRAQGMASSGVPVIDVRGQLLLGFSAQAIDAALRATGG